MTRQSGAVLSFLVAEVCMYVSCVQGGISQNLVHAGGIKNMEIEQQGAQPVRILCLAVFSSRLRSSAE